MHAIPADCITLPEAVKARAEIASGRELSRESDYYLNLLGVPFGSASAEPHLRREAATRELHSRLSDGSVQAYTRDRISRDLMRISHEVWRSLSLWRETIIGGQIQTTVRDGIDELDGHSVFLKRSDFESYLVGVARHKPASIKADCQAWLEWLLRTTPRARRKVKDQLRKEAKARFRVTSREFAECWKLANQAVPEAAARHPGRPKKS